jgi:thiamine-phosphate pyrophosphorylase
MIKPVCRGFYAITDDFLLSGDTLVPAVEQAILGGARLIQYRDKNNTYTQRLVKAEALNRLCHSYRIPLIINDDIELAAQVGADGVHIGKSDTDLVTARAILGSHMIIGVSCYDRLDLAIDSERSGADYVAFGAVFPSLTKKDEIQAPLELIRSARGVLRVPIVAIGGITPANAPLLIEAGVDSLAAISAVFAHSDVFSATRRFAVLFA